jgi:hypothetical protein
MRKPIKPFAVETRRTGRKPLSSKPLSSPGIVMPRDDEAARPPQPEWPPLREDDEDSYGAAMRAADALFSRPAPAPVEQGSFEGEGPASASLAEPPRRILQSLNEDDHILRLLAEEAEHRPKRGRKPREAHEPAPMRLVRAIAPVAPAPEPEVAQAASQPMPAGVISGYVRGEIYARYARREQLRPGEQWRKRGVKPLW